MKTIAARFTETAAVSLAAILLLTAGAASASAQEFKVTGNIPFAFSAGRSAAQPGKYEIAQFGSSQWVLRLYDTANRKGVLVSIVDRIDTPQNAAARAEFSCTSQGCRLVRVFDGSHGYEIAVPRIHPAEQERLLAVNLAPEGRN